MSHLPGQWPTIPGYTLVRRIGFGASGEVFEAIAPGGFAKAIKVVRVDAQNPLSRREVDGVGLIRSIRHPYLIGIDRVELSDSQITIVMELAEGSLREEFQSARTKGLRGIPRRRLLALLAEAAEVLDFLNVDHNVRHLDIKPENLFLVGGHLKVGDFGLVRDAERDTFGSQSHAVTPAYAAPEMFDRVMTATTDQYSLAAVYCEMLTGHLPYTAVHSADLAIKQMTEAPDLSRMPEADRAAVRRALAMNPEDRFAVCMDFIRALRESQVLGDDDGELPSLLFVPHSFDATTMSATTMLTGSASSQNLSQSTANGIDANEIFKTLFVPGRTAAGVVVSHWLSQQSLASMRSAIERFAKERNSPLLEPTAQTLVLYLQGGRRGWRPLLGIRDPFLLTLRLFSRQGSVEETLVLTTLEHHGAKLPPDVFEQHGRVILDELAREVGLYKAAVPVRGEPRKAFSRGVHLVPVGGSLRNIRLACTGIDVSLCGVGLISVVPVDAGLVRIRMQGADATFPARLVRCRQRPTDRNYEIGLMLSRPLPEELLRDEQAENGRG